LSPLRDRRDGRGLRKLNRMIDNEVSFLSCYNFEHSTL
jgi:hypothetical protein